MPGVRIYLATGVRIPAIIRVQDKKIEVRNVLTNGKRTRMVALRGGDATFLPGGIVGVKMPNSSSFWVAFKEKTVLEIRSWQNRLKARNRYLCERCYALTGICERETRVLEKDLHNFVCVDCGHSWDVYL